MRERVYGLTSRDKDRYDAILDAYESASQDGAATGSIEDLLPFDEPLRTLVLVELIKAEMELRGEQHIPTAVEEYLDRFPELRADAEAQAELVVWEHELTGADEPPEAYFARFPHLKSRLWPNFANCGPPSFGTSPPGFSGLQEIGRGAMGIVFRAWDESLGRLVALKFVYPSLTCDRATEARLRAEAQIVASLNNPNIVKVYGVGEHRGALYGVFEFCPGGTLAERLQAGPLPPLAAARLLLALADGVRAAHRARVIHRDLKPENVLFCADGQPKVADFGLALRLGDDRLTQSGDRIGTLSYAAPEQLTRPRDAGKAADVYGLGAVLYHCLTGRPPFCSATKAETYYQVVHGLLVPPRQIVPLPRDLETICLKCLAKSPAERYHSVIEFADDLQRFLAQEPIRARRHSPLARVGAWSRRNPALAAASALTTLALLAVAGLSLLFGITQRQTARQIRQAMDEVRQSQALSDWDRGRELAEEGRVGQGLLLIARALASTSANPGHESLRTSLRLSLAGWLNQCPLLSQVWPHPDKVTALAPGPRGAVTATGCADGKLRIWDTDRGRLMHVLEGHHGDVHCVAFDPAGRFFVSGGADGQLLLWSARTCQLEAELPGHAGEVLAAAFSPDGKFLLTGGADATARLWLVAEHSCRETVEHPGKVHTVGFLGEHQFFVGGASEEHQQGNVRIYELHRQPRRGSATSSPIAASFSFPRPLRSAVGSRDGSTLLAGDDNWEASFWDVAKRRRLATTDEGRGSVRATAILADGTRAALGIRESNAAIVCNVTELRRLYESQQESGITPAPALRKRAVGPLLPHPAPVTGVAFDPADSQRLLTACEDGCVRVWRLAAGPTLRILPHAPRAASDDDPQRKYVVRSVDITPDGVLAATGGWDGQVRLWRVRDATEAGPPLAHPSPVMAVAFSSTGRSLLTGCKDGKLRLWDLATRQIVSEQAHHATVVSGLSVGSKGMVVAGGDGQANCWRIESTGQVEQLVHAGTVLRHAAPTLSVATAVSRSSAHLLTCAEDNRAVTWTAAGAMLAEMHHENQVWGGDFNIDGRLVITASDDRTARVWGTSDGLLHTTLTHDSTVFHAQFIDATRALTASSEGARLWDTKYSRPLGPRCHYRSDILQSSCRDGRIALLAEWSGYGLLWTLPRPLAGDGKTLERQIEKATGLALDEAGGFRTLTWQAWQERPHLSLAKPRP